MQLKSTAFLISALAIVVNQVTATAQFHNYEEKADQLAQEAKNRAVTILDGPKYVASPPAPTAPPTNHSQPETRPPSKPPHGPPAPPDKHGKPKYVEIPRQTIYIGQIQNQYGRNHYPTKVKIHSPNSVYKYQKVIPLQPQRHTKYPKHQQLVYAASTSKPAIAAKSPKFSLPIETINGIRADFVRPPFLANSTALPTASPTSTTTPPPTTTTTRYLRTKRIWPKHILEKKQGNNSTTNTTTPKINTENDLSSSASKIRVVITDNNDAGSAVSSTRAPYRRVTRIPKKKPSTTPPTEQLSHFEPNDWVPIVPSHYPINKVRPKQRHHISRRSDRSEVYLLDHNESPQNKRMMYLQSFGLLPAASSQSYADAARKNIIVVGKGKKLKPHVYSGYRGKPVVHTTTVSGGYDDGDQMKIVTRIKHHHHHHHHRYIKTVEKPVKVEVPKPVPVPMPVPVRVQVEKKVNVPMPVKVPYPVPVKVVEKQYVPKPYPVYQQVPVMKHVEVKVPYPVPVHVEKRVPYPVQVEVPVPKPYPVEVPVETKVPYPVPVRVLVPQPYPVETKVPVPVKEPVEVIKHVPVKVPVPQPYPVKVPHPVPVPVEKRVPYPVEVEKKVPLPVPYRVMVPEKVEVEKRVPVYVPRPFPVEKKVPYPVRVPYPVQVPIKVPVGIPIIVHPAPNQQQNNDFNTQQQNHGFNIQQQSNGFNIQQQNNGFNIQQQNNGFNIQQQNEQIISNSLTAGDGNNQEHNQFSYQIQHNNAATDSSQQTVNIGNQANSINNILNNINKNQQGTVSVHGRPGFGFQSRVDVNLDSGEVTTPLITTTTHEDDAINNMIRTITEKAPPMIIKRTAFGFQSRSDDEPTSLINSNMSNSTETLTTPEVLVTTSNSTSTDISVS